MSEQVLMKNCSEESTIDSEEALAIAYIRNMEILTLIRQFLPLITALQGHRGSTLAAMDGELSFAHESKALTTEVDSRLTFLSHLIEHSEFTDIDLQISEFWSNIKSYKTDPLTCFKMHTHLIEALINQVEELIKLISTHFNSALSRDSGLQKRLILVQLTLRDIPELLEAIAQLRGVSTHIAVLKHCDESNRIWVEQLVRSINIKQEAIRKYTKATDFQLFASKNQMASLVNLQVQDVRLVQLNEYIKKSLLLNEDINADAHYIFNLATKIIDSQLETMYQGILFLEGQIHSYFDQHFKP